MSPLQGRLGSEPLGRCGLVNARLWAQRLVGSYLSAAAPRKNMLPLSASLCQSAAFSPKWPAHSAGSIGSTGAPVLQPKA